MPIVKKQFAEWTDEQTNLRIAAATGGNLVEVHGADGVKTQPQAAELAQAMTEAAELAKPPAA
jgi:hypothetical protein